MSVRIGLGYDIHRLVSGRPLLLGCVEIPFDRGLQGHSDGDAAAHAAADAALGAAGLGDIGEYFPDTDPSNAGIPGRDLLRRAAERVRETGARIAQLDLTVLAEAPRLAPHRDAMRTALAEAIGIGSGDVSIKARTHEGVGAIGRGEAIAVYAVVLLELPGTRGRGSHPAGSGGQDREIER